MLNSSSNKKGKFFRFISANTFGFQLKIARVKHQNIIAISNFISVVHQFNENTPKYST